jgi:hypothetical protein
MQINGPLELQIIEDEGNRELHIKFKEDYQKLDLKNRVEKMKQHLKVLHTSFLASNDEAEKQGMQMIIQVVSQIIPLIETDKMVNDETIILELGKTTSINSLIDNVTTN